MSDLKDKTNEELLAEVDARYKELAEREQNGGFFTAVAKGSPTEWEGTKITANTDFNTLERMFADIGNNPKAQQVTFRVLKGLIFGVLVSPEVENQLVRDANAKAATDALKAMGQGDQVDKAKGIILGLDGKPGQA